ncbi:MAG: GNAT family N-acetyltransferase [Vicinamibacteraceae bacterium]
MNVTRDIGWLRERRDAWNALARLAANPLLEADWILSTVDTLHRERDFRLIAIERDGRLCAAAPLVASAQGRLGPLELAGMATLYEPGDLLFEDDAALGLLVSALVRQGRPLLLARLPAASPAVARIAGAVRRPGLVLTRQTASALAIPIAGAWEAFEQTLSSRLTSNVKRLSRKAARAHPVRTEVLSPTPADVPDLFQRFMEVEASGWKGRAASSLMARAPLRAFFTRYLTCAADAGRLRLSMLWFGDRLAAAEIALVAYDRWWQLKIGYDDACADLYPGLQLTYASVRHAFDTGLAGYEFLGSAAEWERRWNPDERQFVTLAVYPPTISGAVGLGADATRHAARRIIKAIRRS